MSAPVLSAAGTALAATGPALIGAATGLRSQWGLTALSLTAPPTAVSPVEQALSRPWARRVTLGAVAAEFVADKTPRVPSRLSRAGLLPRIALGALTGAELARRRPGGVSVPVAAATGGAAALAAAGAGVLWRQTARPVTHTDVASAVIEDAVAAVLALVACLLAPAARAPRDEDPRKEPAAAAAPR